MPGRPFNLEIWPPGGYDLGSYFNGNKVMNVDWDERGKVDIITFRGGCWEDELLALLENADNILFLPRRC